MSSAVEHRGGRGRGFGGRGRGFGDRGRGGDRGGMSRGRGANFTPREGRGGGQFGSRGSGGSRGGFRGRGNGRGFSRGGRGRGFGDSGSQNKKITFDEDGEDESKPVAASTPAATAAADAGPQPKKRREFITTMTDDGTELPMKLNNKVFIDGLAYNDPKEGLSIEDALTDFVEKWKVGKVVNFIKKPGQGFGYLCFRSPNSVEAAINVLNGRKFMGRELRVEKPKEKSDNPAVGEKRGREDALGQQSFTRQVLVSDLSTHANPEIIKEVLRELAPDLAGRVQNIKMVGKGRKAFITFFSEDDVESAIAFLNGFSLLGRIVAASRAHAPGTLPYSKPELVAKVKPQTAADGTAQATYTGSGAAAAAAKKQGGFDYDDHGPDEVLVGNLAETITLEQLKGHFATCGRIVDAEIFKNEHTKQPVGIARVQFALPAHAKYAKENLDGSRLAGSIVRIDRGEEVSKVGQEGEADAADEDSEYDEEGFLRHMGVKDKDRYFADVPDVDGVNPTAKKPLAKKSKQQHARTAPVKLSKKAGPKKAPQDDDLGFDDIVASGGGGDDDDDGFDDFIKGAVADEGEPVMKKTRGEKGGSKVGGKKSAFKGTKKAGGGKAKSAPTHPGTVEF